jgi:N-acetylglucosamine kinase-like BadF-type ATPase
MVLELDKALQLAWELVRASDDAALNSEEYNRTSLAKHIMAAARGGEARASELAQEAVQRFKQQIALEIQRPDSKGG